MIHHRKSQERGHANHGWLDTYHTFSFADYMDPKYMGYRSLRVINEDFVDENQGFPTHGHRDMEIITYILNGQLGHKDSMGNGAVIKPGEVQRMSAGTGVTHSEFNPSKTEKVHLLQIWILPEKFGLTPSYEQTFFDIQSKKNRLHLVGSKNPKDGAVKIHQDAELFAGVLEKGKEVDYTVQNNRYLWLQVARGGVQLDNISMKQGDGAAVEKVSSVKIKANEPSEVLLFDLA